MLAVAATWKFEIPNILEIINFMNCHYFFKEGHYLDPSAKKKQ